MENRVWKGMANVKFRSIYTAKVSRRINYIGNGYSIFFSLASASSVATWAIWKEYPYLWATIVAISQVLHIAKPYLPFSKGARDFIEMSLLYEEIYLEYEKLWYDNIKENRNEAAIEKRLNELKQKEHGVDKRYKHIVCPEFKSLINKADNETNNFLTNSF
jgi:hypothetical protein